MKVWLCDCGCEIRDTKPKECPLCKRKGNFSETDFQDPSNEDKKYSKLYQDSLKQLEEYEEGCPVKHQDPCGEDC
ncbi:MAG TPA: hypothetical protein VJG90_03235 [Candidatus Nanoarchaeia archaeon]|nr:hypothetical protein [Candidatus Nanoarchaeia archaeon]